jgi:hypothetical protein
MKQMFSFDPLDHAPILAAQDYVHIPHGLTEEFYQLMSRQVDEYYEARRLSEHARGDKQQALYDFPSAGHYHEFVTTLGALSGLPADQLVISERHIKGYEPGAAPRPMPHKDRHATQLAVGFTVRAPEGSTLVLYPQGERRINPFSSWAEMRASLPEDQLPPAVLRAVPRVEIQDQPGDVVVFHGNEIWHGRENGANTVMLYFKLNAFHSDPLGEDPNARFVTRQTRRLAELPDEQLVQQVAVLGRRVDYLHRRYNRHWQELLGVVLTGESHFTVDAAEWQLLHILDGQRPLRELLHQLAAPTQHDRLLAGVRRLAERGVIDLLPAVAQESIDCIVHDNTAAELEPAVAG